MLYWLSFWSPGIQRIPWYEWDVRQAYDSNLFNVYICTSILQCIIYIYYIIYYILYIIFYILYIIYYILYIILYIIYYNIYYISYIIYYILYIMMICTCAIIVTKRTYSHGAQEPISRCRGSSCASWKSLA